MLKIKIGFCKGEIMRVLILDRDTDYSQRLKYYFSQKYIHMQIAVCDNIKSAREVMQNKQFDVILFDAEFDDVNLEELTPLLNKAVFAYLSETNEIVNECDTFMKYSRLSDLYKKICELYEKKRNRIIKKEEKGEKIEKKTEIITFLPVHGGAGSSTMAAACAIAFSSDYKVLYVNLEQRPSDSVFFTGNGKKGISDIVSILKTKYTDAGLGQALSEVIQQAQQQEAANVFFIKGYSNIMDCMSMTEQSMEALLKALKEKLDYRFIIIDSDFIVSGVLGKLITATDKLVFVSSGSDISNSKLLKIQRYLDILKRNDDYEMPENYLLLNQYYGLNDELTIAQDMEIIAKLARYRTEDNSRITSQNIIKEVLGKKNVFDKLKPVGTAQEES